MARQDFERGDERHEGRSERRFARGGNGGERDDWSSGSRRQGSGREPRTGDRDYGREQQEWARGSERTRDTGYEYGSGEHGTQQWGEGRWQDRDREYRERTEGYGGRGWESSGMGQSGMHQGGMYQGGMGQGGMTQRYGGQSSGPWGQTGSSYGPRGMGQHYGRGPKGYRRSDERIREDVNEALFRDEHVDATEIEVEVKDAEVTLSGTVDGREAKRMAEDCVWNVAGVRNVTNTIRVEPDKHGERSTMGSGGMEEKSRRTSGQPGKSGNNT